MMTIESDGPVVQRALLTDELLRLRRQSSETQDAVAKALEWSVSKFIRIEGGYVGISKSDLEALLRHYGVTDSDHIGELVERAREARSQGWWARYSIPDKVFHTYIGYEAGASSIRMAQGLLIPGLLQIEEYARRVAATYVAPDRIDSVVSLRNERQKRVLARNTKQLYILDEAVIRRKVDSVMPRQLHHLAEVGERPDVTIRVIPFTAGPHFAMRGPFTLLGFDAGLDDVLYLESVRHGELVIASRGGETVAGHDSADERRNIGEIAEYIEGFDGLLSLALDAGQSADLIRRVADEMS
jgi:transcriptional regulator with XRE-family HTH domain